MFEDHREKECLDMFEISFSVGRKRPTPTRRAAPQQRGWFGTKPKRKTRKAQSFKLFNKKRKRKDNRIFKKRYFIAPLLWIILFVAIIYYLGA